jgi:hypothetical protein
MPGVRCTPTQWWDHMVLMCSLIPAAPNDTCWCAPVTKSLLIIHHPCFKAVKLPARCKSIPTRLSEEASISEGSCSVAAYWLTTPGRPPPDSTDSLRITDAKECGFQTLV